MTNNQIIARLRAEGKTDWYIASYLRGWRQVGQRYVLDGADLI